MSAHGVMLRFCSVVVWLLLFALSTIALAQSDAVPVQIGQNAIGTLSAEATTAQFTFSASGGETASVQVLALTPDFAPRFRILNPAGVEILTVLNPDGLSSLSADASFVDAGDYIIEVSGENGGTGQFVLSLQPGAALPEPVELTANAPVSDTVGSQTPVHVYRFSASATDALILSILTDSQEAGVLVSLFDEDAGKAIASSDATLSGVAYRLPRQERHFRLEVRAGGGDDTAFSICLGNCDSGLLASGTNSQPSVEVVETPEIVPTSCTVASGTGGSINIRSGPGTQYAVIGNLAAGGSLPVLGQLAGGGWYQVSINGQTGWAAASVTRLDGECSNLPVVAAPAGAQLAPTQAPPPTNPPPPPGGGGSTPTNTPSATIIPSATPTSIQLPDLTVRIDTFWIDGAGAAHVDYTMSNIGSAPTISSFILTLCVDLTCSTYNIVENMAPGFSSSGTTIRNEWEADPLAAFPRATVTIDSGGAIAESNEGNNVASAFPA